MNFKYTIGCITTPVSRISPRQILELIRDLNDPSITLLLLCRRDPASDFNIRNYIERHGLDDRIHCVQFYQGAEIEDRRNECGIWIERNTPPEALTAKIVREKIAKLGPERMEISDGKRHALFFTGFHPYKNEGQAVYMRFWLSSLRKAGYEVHLVYYQNDMSHTPPEARSAAAADFIHYLEIPVITRLAGRNQNGLNVDVDDWCGEEALNEIRHLSDRYDFRLALVVYPFYSAVLEALPNASRKILLSPDSFADRNRKMLEQGYSRAGWISITPEGERQAVLRADLVVAIKRQEAEWFETLSSGKSEVACVGPAAPLVDFPRKEFDGILRIGYMASNTQVNRECLLEFLRCRADSELLRSKSALVIAGEVCRDHSWISDAGAVKEGELDVLGRIDSLRELFARVDLVVNPDIGGTGLKVKTIEPMYYGIPVVSTAAAAEGLDSGSRFHQAPGIEALPPLLEELVSEPGLLSGLGREGLEIARRLNRESVSSLSAILGCSPSVLDPGSIEAEDAESLYPEVRRKRAKKDGREPMVSVVLPFYNDEKNLETAVASVLDHDYPRMELILVDDGSIDSSGKLADRLAAADSRVSLLRHPVNRGAGPARNTGANSASGEFLFYIDSDDILRRGALRLLVNTAREQGVGLVVGSCNQIDEEGNYGDYDRLHDGGREEAFGLIDGLEGMRRSLNIDEGSFLPVRPWGMLIDLDLFRRSGLQFPSGEYEDLSVLPFLYKSASRLVYLPDIVVTYRIRKGSVTQSPLTLGKVSRYRDLWHIISNRIEEFGVEEYREDFKVFHLSHLLWLLHNGITDRNVLEAAASLIREEMSLSNSGLDRERSLVYLMEYLEEILGRAGLEKDYALWKAFVSSIGADTLATYFRQRIFGIEF